MFFSSLLSAPAPLSFFPLIYIFYWSIVDFWCFRYTARWFSYTYIHILFLRLFSIIGYYKILIRVPVPYRKPLLLVAKVSFKIINLVFYSYKSNKWNQNVINFLVRQKFLSFLKYIHMLFMYVYTKAFLLHLIKAWENKKKEEMEKLENIN